MEEKTQFAQGRAVASSSSEGAPNDTKEDCDSAKSSGTIISMTPTREKSSSHNNNRSRKAREMPRRPLSAYNLFFREQRELIIAERTRQLPPSQLQTSTRRRRKQPKAKISFEELAKLVGARWKTIDPQELLRLKAMAETDANRYKTEMKVYQQTASSDHGDDDEQDEGKRAAEEPNVEPLQSGLRSSGSSFLCPLADELEQKHRLGHEPSTTMSPMIGASHLPRTLLPCLTSYQSATEQVQVVSFEPPRLSDTNVLGAPTSSTHGTMAFGSSRHLLYDSTRRGPLFATQELRQEQQLQEQHHNIQQYGLHQDVQRFHLNSPGFQLQPSYHCSSFFDHGQSSFLDNRSTSQLQPMQDIEYVGNNPARTLLMPPGFSPTVGVEPDLFPGLSGDPVCSSAVPAPAMSTDNVAFLPRIFAPDCNLLPRTFAPEDESIGDMSWMEPRPIAPGIMEQWQQPQFASNSIPAAFMPSQNDENNMSQQSEHQDVPDNQSFPGCL